MTHELDAQLYSAPHAIHLTDEPGTLNPACVDCQEMTAPYAGAPGSVRATLAHPVDRYTTGYPHYQPETVAAPTIPGRHHRRITRAARLADPRRWAQLHGLIIHRAAERVELRRTGQPLTTRSAA